MHLPTISSSEFTSLYIIHLHLQQGKTVLGAPNSVINLGNTEIPKEIMMMQLEELGQNDFK